MVLLMFFQAVYFRHFLSFYTMQLGPPKIEELPPLPEFPTAARISEFVAQLEELMGRMNPTSYGPTGPHLWLVGKIPPKTWENCRETSKRKFLTHSYDDIGRKCFWYPLLV